MSAIKKATNPGKIFNLAAEQKQDKIMASVSNVKLNNNETIVFALVQNQATTMVQRGENAGKELAHVHIVRAFANVPGKNNTVEFSWKEKDKSQFFVAALIQDKSSGGISGFRKTIIN
jgi:hypothetical protein